MKSLLFLKTTLITLYTIRILLLFSPSYIHPDEYMQSILLLPFSNKNTYTNNNYINPESHIPWDMRVSSKGGPIRSVLPLMIPYLPSYSLLPLLSYLRIEVNTSTLYFLGRFALWVTSVCSIDLYALPLLYTFYYSNNSNSNSSKNGVETRLKLLILYNLLPTTLLYTTRSFANNLITSLYTLFLTTLLPTSTTSTTSTSTSKPYTAGFIASVALFVHPTTFVIIAIPPTIHYLYKSIDTWNYKPAIESMVAFTLTSSVFVLIDSLYYHGDNNKIEIEIVVTPLNAIAYNLNPKNLALHGLHHRLTHIIMNLPVLILGIPVFLLLIYQIVNVTSTSMRKGVGRLVILGCYIVVPVVILSCAVHQEGRFLTWLGPVCAVFLSCCFEGGDYDDASDSDNTKTNTKETKTKTKTKTMRWFKGFISVQTLNSVIIVVLFGVFNNAGVVRSLLDPPSYSYSSSYSSLSSSSITNVNDNTCSSTSTNEVCSTQSQSQAKNVLHLVYYRTLTPPPYLLPKPQMRNWRYNMKNVNDDGDSEMNLTNLLIELCLNTNHSRPENEAYILKQNSIPFPSSLSSTSIAEFIEVKGYGYSLDFDNLPHLDLVRTGIGGKGWLDEFKFIGHRVKCFERS